MLLPSRALAVAEKHGKKGVDCFSGRGMRERPCSTVPSNLSETRMTIDSQLIAAWVQGGAVLTQAGVAIALFVITKRYVTLTARMAASSEAQVELLRAERELGPRSHYRFQ